MLYSNYFKANLTWVTLLSERFVADNTVFRSGEWHQVTVEDVNGVTYFNQVSKGPPIHDWDIVFTSSVIRQWRVYLTLTWYYPKRGSFVVKLRLDDPPVRRNNTRVRFPLPITSQPYMQALARAIAARNAWLNRRSGNKVSSPSRPNPQARYHSYPVYHYGYYVSTGNGINESFGTTAPVNTYYRTWTGTRTPGFWSKTRRQLPENPHTVSITEVDMGTLIECTYNDPALHPAHPGDYSNDVNIHTNHYPPPYPGGNPLSGTLAATGRAGFSALNRLQTAMQNETVNIAQDIGEIGETIAMIHKTISRVHGAHTMLRGGNIPGAIRALWQGNTHGSPNGKPFRNALSESRTLAQNWLELQYGWKPLLMDIHDGIEKVRVFAKNAPRPLIVSEARASGSSFTNDYTDIMLYGFPTVKGGRRNWVTKGTVKYKVRYQMEDAHLAFLAQTGFTNPINLVWELLPYSFVVDWFLTVGPWLESFSSYQGLKFYDGMKLTFERLYVTDSVQFGPRPPLPGYTYKLAVQSGAQWRYVWLKRERLTSFPRPAKPVFKSPWSTGHVLNALALLASSFGYSRTLHV